MLLRNHNTLLLAVGVTLVTMAGQLPAAAGPTEELESLCADRGAIERVYHSRRTGANRSFEEAMPPDLLRSVVRSDLKKEAVLERVYHLAITPEMVAAEVERITTTTRAPEVLAEIKRALGNDGKRFARSMARPLVVERELRRRFNGDAVLHAPQRKEAERARERLLAGEQVENMHEVTWKLTARPPDEAPPSGTTPPPQTAGQAASDDYAVEATAQVAQPLTSPAADRTPDLYFEDLDPELQKVLHVQLRKSGDVSAVIEAPGAFLIFQAIKVTDSELSVSSLSFRKRSYHDWLETQPD